MTARTLIEKTRPEVLHASDKMHALLGLVLGEHRTEPYITGRAITADGFVMVSTSRDPLMNEIFGTVSECRRNLVGAFRAVGLTPDEQSDADRLIEHWFPA